jgi:hypothetical protein
MKHTPGSWQVGYGTGLTGPRTSPIVYLDKHGISEIPIRVGDHAVAWVLSSKDLFDGRELADAQLIAAAPDLLEALQKALMALDAIGDEMTVGERYTNAGQYLLDALIPARDAIAKASGDTQ